MERRKKLIEVALPLEAINKEAAREKSIWHGHQSMLYSDNLTVEKILTGNSNIRNPILVSYVATAHRKAVEQFKLAGPESKTPA